MSEFARVSEIVTQTLKFHRQQSHPVVVQVPEIVDSVLALYQNRLSSAHVAIERDFRGCRPILARAGELRQVIANLIGNALDAMGGGGRLKIRIANTQEYSNGARCGIRLTISDTGSGIQPEIRANSSSPLSAPKAITVLASGCGLALRSVQNMAEPFR